MTILYILCLVLAVTSSEIQTEESLAVTIYNNDFAMVKDVRSIQFDAGESVLYFTDVSENIQTETVTFKALKNPQSIRVYEQNFQKNLVNEQGILKKYINQEIDVVAQFGDQVKRIKGTLLSQGSSYILKTADNKVIIAQKITAVELPALPQGFFTVPTLNWKVWSKSAQTTSCEVAYRTTGFSWKSDYTIVLDKTDKKADIGGWVTIDNQSGKKYVNAKLKLIAGDVNIVKTPQPAVQYDMVYEEMADVAYDAAPSFSEKSFADYHLYTLSDVVTLNQSSQKQVEFIPKVYGVPLRKYNEISISSGGYSNEDIKAQSKIEFVNSAQNGLGIPFPKGTVRAFKEDPDDGSLQFIGEDSIDHTSKDQNISLLLGNSFDVKADLFASNRRSFSNGGYSANMNLTLTNHKEEQVEVVVIYNNYYGDNLQVTWDSKNVATLQKLSTSKYQIIVHMKNNQKVVLKWKQNYTS